MLTSYKASATERIAHTEEINFEAQTGHLLFVEGPQVPFRVELAQGAQKLGDYRSIINPFPLVVIFVKETENVEKLSLQAVSQYEKNLNLRVTKIAASSVLPDTLLKNIALAANTSDTQTLSEYVSVVTDPRIKDYLNLILNYQRLRSLGQNSERLAYYSKDSINENKISHLRRLFFNIKLAEKRKAYTKNVESLTFLMQHIVEQKLDKIYPFLNNLIKSEVALIFADIDYKNLIPLMRGSEAFCNTHFFVNSDKEMQYDLMKQCFIEEPYLSWSVNDYRDLLWVFIKAHWLYFNRLNQHENAITFLASRLKIHDKELKDFEKSALLQLIGLSYEYVGKLADARNAFHKSIELLSNKQDHSKDAWASLSDGYYNLALFYLNRGELQKAKLYIDKSLNIDSLHGDKQNYYISLYALGKIERKLGNATKAKAIHTEVSNNISPERYHYITTQIEQAKNNIALKEYRNAELTLNEICFTKNASLMYEAQIMDCLLLKIETNIENNDIEKSLSTIQLAYKCMAEKACTNKTLLEVHQQPPSSKQDQCNAKVNNPISHSHYPARQIILLTLDMQAHRKCTGYLYELYRIAQQKLVSFAPEFSQAESFISATNNLFTSYLSALFDNSNKLGPKQKQAIFEALESYQNFKFSIRKIASFQPEVDTQTENTFTTLWQQKLKIRKELLSTHSNTKSGSALRLKDTTLSNKISMLMAKKPQKTAYFSTKTLEDISGHLKKGVAIAHIFSTNSKLHVIFSTSQESTFYSVERTAEFEAKMEKFKSNINPQSLLGVLRSFFVSYFFPLKKVNLEGVSKLVLVSDGLIDTLPFSAFNLAESQEQYQPLAENIQIVKTISASKYFDDISMQNPGGHDIAVFADPAFSSPDWNALTHSQVQRSWLPNLPPLPFTRKEALQVASIFDTKDVYLMLGRNATNAALFDADVRNAKILHIATHGLLDENYPDISAFVTSKYINKNMTVSDFLVIDELTKYVFKSSLVLLSGCETAKGAYFNGVGINGLTQQFIQQGAGSVISTLWKIDDRPTAAFMKYFYEALKRHNGESATALLEAKRKFIRSGIYSHPKYWAGFVLTSSNQIYESINL